ncbi:Nitrate transporter 1.1 [Apostasia shenzhenica]|uniref:Nitrate transporter 1.1 n=1 Tax=Apostasia shenzhenica TaxID=1088818 RepID=A0A2I0B5M7_9ASPA|nr:Nitrate transporter 1.1 [Apostasia shenzhenica]
MRQAFIGRPNTKFLICYFIVLSDHGTDDSQQLLLYSFARIGAIGENLRDWDRREPRHLYLVGDLHLPTSKSADIVTNFIGTLNLLALPGGFLADAKLGRYLTIAVSAAIAATVRKPLSPDLNSIVNA